MITVATAIAFDPAGIDAPIGLFADHYGVGHAVRHVFQLHRGVIDQQAAERDLASGVVDVRVRIFVNCRAMVITAANASITRPPYA